MKLNQDLLRSQRAQIALHMDALLNRPSTTGAEIAAIQPPEDQSEGGVALSGIHLLDQDNEDSNDADPELMAFSDDDSDSGTETGVGSRNQFPTLGEAALMRSKGKSKAQPESIMDRVDNWNVGGNINSASLTPLTPTFATGLFPIEQGKGEGTGMTMIDFRQSIIPGNEGKDLRIRTDWDNANFQRHPVDGQYHCPFIKCS